MDNRQLLLRGLPKIDELLLDEQLVFFMESTPRSVVVDAAREIIDELRREILSGEREDTPEKDELIAEICDRITGKKKRNLRTLINATGVVLHTNLGRSNLCRAAVESVTAVAHCLHLGRTPHLWNVEVRDRQGRLVSTARVLNMIVPLRRAK